MQADAPFIGGYIGSGDVISMGPARFLFRF